MQTQGSISILPAWVLNAKKMFFFCPARSFSICSIFIALIVSNRKQCLFLFRLLDFFHFPCAFLSLSFSCSLPLNSKLTIWENQIKMPLKKIVYFRGLKVWLCVDGKDSYVWHVSCYYSWSRGFHKQQTRRKKNFLTFRLFNINFC